MAKEKKKVVRQNLTREEKIAAALNNSLQYKNRYGMTPQQIYRALSGKEPKKASEVKTKKVAKQQPKIQRPKIAQRSDGRTSNYKLLLETPAVSTQIAVAYPTPNWFEFKGKADVSIIIPIYKSAEVLKDLIATWDLGNDNYKTEIILIDDCCPQNSKDVAINLWEERLGEKKQPIGRIYYSPKNQGYATSCNIGAQHATGDYLIFLNADTITTQNWIRPMIRLLNKKEVGIVGNLILKHGGEHHERIDSAGSEWSWNDNCFHHVGRNIYKSQMISQPFALTNAPADLFNVQERDMVTGACLAIRKEVFERIGGFNPNYQIGYWEDSDLCMTVLEAGYKVLYQPLSKIYHKGGHSGAGDHKYSEHNRNYFINRWFNSGRMDSLVFNKRQKPTAEIRSILIKREGAYGDVLVAAAVAPALKKKFPNCKILFNTSCEEVLEGNPYIDKIVGTHEMSERTFQLYYNLDLVYEYRPNANFLNSYAEFVGVPVEDCKLFLPTNPVSNLPEDYIVIHSGRTTWVGRDWSPLKFEVLANKLRKMGQKIVCVGTRTDHKVSCDLDLRDKTNIAETAYVIQNAKLFIGVDSFPMHIAQTFDTKGICFFGCVLPETRIISPNMKGVNAEGLKCLGCHHRRPVPCTFTNVCETSVLDCVNLVSVETMMKRIQEICPESLTV